MRVNPRILPGLNLRQNTPKRCTQTSREGQNTVPAKNDNVGTHVYLPLLKVMSFALNVGSQGSQLTSDVATTHCTNAHNPFPLPYCIIYY